MANQACSRCGGKNGNHQEWCPFNPKHWEPALVVAGVLTPPTMGGYSTAMTNTSGTQTIALADLPANAVTEDQAVDMLGAQGIYHDRVYSAFYRLRTRTSTLLEQGGLTFRIERITEGIYVVTLEA